jgi:two-component system chemotaxis response regulator CheY
MKILIAEDDPVSLELLVDILSSARAGYELLPVEDGARAWEVVQANPDVRLALVDLGMPGMSGIELLDRIRSDTRFAQLPVIVCTGNTDRATVAAVAQRGISNFLVKPFTRSTVLEKVLQICKPVPVSHPVVHDLAAVRQRFEIDRETHRELLSHYVRIVDLWVGDARRVIEFPRVRALAIRAGNLKQTMAGLGAAAVAARLQEAEEALNVHRVRPLNSELPAILRKTQQLGDRLQPDLDRLRQALDTLT